MPNKKRSNLTKAGISFLESNDVARLATATKDGLPQVTPIVYAMDGENLVVATDYGTRKLKNLKENPRASLVVDSTRPNRGIMIVGDVQIFERGKEYLRLLDILYNRFDFYKKNPWREGESPILLIRPKSHASWGI